MPCPHGSVLWNIFTHTHFDVFYTLILHGPPARPRLCCLLTITKSQYEQAVLYLRTKSLSLAGKSPALNFSQGLHSAQNSSCAEDSHREKNVAERQSPVVEKVDKLDREDRTKEGRVRQRGRSQGFGKAAQVRAEEAEPLCRSIGLAVVPYTHEMS